MFELNVEHPNLEILGKRQEVSRTAFGLPVEPPDQKGGVVCGLCANQCRIGEGQVGYCGLRTVEDGRLVHLAGTSKKGLLHWYHDPLPTNCVASWVCGAGEFRDCNNLAVFYQSCTANCLFCQNWQFRQASPGREPAVSAEEIAGKVNNRTFCVCFFGGDPASQMKHSLAAARKLSKQGVRICWETNGMQAPELIDAALEIALESGGCIKFDLKAFDDPIHKFLTGVSNQRILRNFSRAAGRFEERLDPPLLIASSLLVPAYIDPDQIRQLAEFISNIHPDIPYSLLGFSPNYYLHDLPCTTQSHAQEAQSAARMAGLTNVRVANRHLLDWGYV